MRAISLLWLLSLAGLAFALPSPELPGNEVQEGAVALQRSTALVEPLAPIAIDSSGWAAPDVDEQLSRDRNLVGMGMGALFVPTMTESRLEPEILVTDMVGEKEWTGMPGHRITLEPGTYTVRVGSGNFRQKQVFKAVVTEGHTTVVQAGWGGLVVETRDETGDWIDEAYDVYSLSDGESYGRGYGQTQERLKDLRTWLLPPGIYRVVRSGESFSSTRNFVTVQLDAGKLTPMELVFEDSTGYLIAGGVRSTRARFKSGSYWDYGLRLGGSVLYSSMVNRNGKESDAWNVLLDTRARLTYDHSNWFGAAELSLRDDFQWADDEAGLKRLNIQADNAQLQTSVVRRLQDWLGPYARATLKTHLVTANYFDPDYRIAVLNMDGDTIRWVEPLERFVVRPPFYPLRLGEGLGVNLEMPGFLNWLEFSAQGGVAWRQVFLDGALVTADKQGLVWEPQPDERTFGLEGAMVGKVRLWRNASVDLRGEIFFPDADPERFELETASLDFRFTLIRNVEVAVLEEILDRGTTSGEVVAVGPRFALRSGVQLRIAINY